MMRIEPGKAESFPAGAFAPRARRAIASYRPKDRNGLVPPRSYPGVEYHGGAV